MEVSMPKIQNQQPDVSWPLPRLGTYAQNNLNQVQHLTRDTAVNTYRAGQALYFAQKKLIGTWSKWLTSQGIPYATAWQAIKLYAECPSETDLGGLSITEAKIKFGIFKEYMPADEQKGNRGNGGGGGGGRSISTPNEEQDPEQLLSLFYHRLKGAAEIAKSLPWAADLLYTSEVEDAIKFCQYIQQEITRRKGKIKPPKAGPIFKRLAELDKV